MDKNQLLILLLDYAPLLQGQPQALALYLYYDASKGKDNMVHISYNAISQHLGISKPTISSCIKVLREYGLIKAPEQSDDGPPCHSHHAEIPPLRSLTNVDREKLFKSVDRPVLTDVRQNLLEPENLPLEYQQLFSPKDLQRALDKLGSDNFNIKHLIEFFKLDENVVRLWNSSPAFKKKFNACRQEILSGTAKPVSLRKEKKERKERSADETYDGLMKVHLSRKTSEEIPVEEWKSPQLLRQFCLLYEQKNNCRYVLVGDSFSSKELKDMKRLLTIFEDDARKSVKYLTWVFEHKNKVLPGGVLSTGICLHPRMLNEFQKANTKTEFFQTDPIDEDFQKWILKNVPDVVQRVKYMRDLYWLKDEYDAGEADKEAKVIVEEGIRRRIIPAKGNIVCK